MRRRFVGGNWKMNGSGKEAENLITALIEQLKGFSSESLDIAVFPSFVYLPQVNELLKNENIQLGAQNLSQHEKGAYTGEISGSMLADIGCRYVLVGHSERRHLYAESNELVAEKFKVALDIGLTPVLCVGETREQYETGQTENVVLEQITTVTTLVGIAQLSKAVIAYEPVWAIGTGLTATPEQAQEAHAFIRQTIAEHDVKTAEELSIIYGGSVKADNATALFSMSDVDGGLIGGASLNAEQFAVICQV